jgi:hypothetical protein
MRLSALLLTVACSAFLAGCGVFSGSGEFDAYGNPTNVSPGGYFKLDWMERGFSSRSLTRCQFNSSQNGLGVLEVNFQVK